MFPASNEVIADDSEKVLLHFVLQYVWQRLNQAFSGISELLEVLTLGVMLFVMQKARCCWMLSMLWQCCCFVVLRYFCRARAMEGKMAWAASRGSITSPGVFFCSSSCIRLICVKASSTATTRLPGNTVMKLEFGNKQDDSVISYSTHNALALPCLLKYILLVIGGKLITVSVKQEHGGITNIHPQMEWCCFNYRALRLRTRLSCSASS